MGSAAVGAVAECTVGDGGIGELAASRTEGRQSSLVQHPISRVRLVKSAQFPLSMDGLVRAAERSILRLETSLRLLSRANSLMVKPLPRALTDMGVAVIGMAPLVALEQVVRSRALVFVNGQYGMRRPPRQ